MDKENIELLNYFNKFKDNVNYDELRKKLDVLSTFRYHYDIKIGEHKIPYVGPDENLNHFSNIITKCWGKNAGKEVAHLLKYYEGGVIENIEEALIILEIKNNQQPSELYSYIKNTLLTNNEFSEEKLKFLLDNNDILSTNLYFYLISL
jgi:hypothetical protein